jgi:hypothetical protein
MDKERTRERSLSCGWEGDRVQEQSLALAYELLWPVLKRRLTATAQEQPKQGVQLLQACGG